MNTEALGGPRLTVVTFNMLHGFGDRLNDDTLDERLGLLAAALREDPPDVVILQEASVTGRHGNVVDRLRLMLNEDLAASGLSYNSAQLLANGSTLVDFFEGSAILSRSRILSAEGITYRTQALIPPERRVGLLVRLLSARGDVAVVGTHLTNTEARMADGLVRTRQARELIAWIAGEAPGSLAIVGGDFNDVPGSATIQAMRAAGARDAWAEAAGQARALGSGLTALNGTVRDPEDFPEDRIDYIFLFGGTLEVQNAAAFLSAPLRDSAGRALWASDHVGVRVELSFP